MCMAGDGETQPPRHECYKSLTLKQPLETKMIRNFLTCEKETAENSHDGVGSIEIQKIFRRKDFSGAWDFALRVVMPPNTSMGIHEHGKDEEMYIILKGEGLMTIEDKEHRISEGDMILNRPGGRHGLFNDGTGEIDLLIIQASNKSSL